MTKHKKDPDLSGRKQPGSGKTGGSEAEVKAEADCRCKEVSKKSIPGMFNLMLDDLAFWKKIKRGK